MDFFCVPLPATDYELCVGFYHVGIFALIALIATVARWFRVHPTENPIVADAEDSLSPSCVGGKTDGHPLVYMQLDDMGFVCPVCGRGPKDSVD
jgi:hypothetical protein